MKRTPLTRKKPLRSRPSGASARKGAPTAPDASPDSPQRLPRSGSGGRPGKSRKRINPVNKARRAKRFAEAFGAKAEWIREFPCAVPQCTFQRPRDWWTGGSPTQAAHVRSRGAGGKSADLVPLCVEHHAEQHASGIRTFQKVRGLNLTALAADLEAQYQRLTQGEKS